MPGSKTKNKQKKRAAESSPDKKESYHLSYHKWYQKKSKKQGQEANKIHKESNKNSKSVKPRQDFKPNWSWSPAMAVAFVIFLYLSQYLVAFALLIYPALRHWDKAQSQAWLTNSIAAQFIFVVLAEAVTIGLLYWFLKKHKVGFRQLGWNRRPEWQDLGMAALAFVAYFIVLTVVLDVVTGLIPGINVSQKQQLGFTNAAGVWQLILTYLSLAVLPPLVEETVFRGFLFGSLRKGMTMVQSAIGTSFLFAVAHLELGGGAPPLWTAAIDVFVLSLALCYLRVKTQSLWSGVMLHSLKNTIAFLVLFVFTFNFL